MSSLPSRNFGRSHRSSVGKSTLKFAIEESKRLLGVPEGYRLGIVPASDTGAFEMAMWSFLGHPEGPKDVDVLHWESFGKGWQDDIEHHLQIPRTRRLDAPLLEDGALRRACDALTDQADARILAVLMDLAPKAPSDNALPSSVARAASTHSIAARRCGLLKTSAAAVAAAVAAAGTGALIRANKRANTAPGASGGS